MFRFLRALYLTQRFFYLVFSLAVGFLISFWFPAIYPGLWVLTIVLLLFFLVDLLALFKRSGIRSERILPEKFSNSDENPVSIQLFNTYAFEVYAEVIDEIPIQFQKRDFLRKLRLSAKDSITFDYYLRPIERGEYKFGNLNVYAATKLKLAKRRFTFQNDQMVKVYPSFLQMKKYDFLADNRLSLAGQRKVRRIGHTMEFEQIKEYVPGDDIRTINWKATAKRGGLMTNQFQDEKAQPVYSIIDLSRNMKMPFNGLKLLDYAINSCLAFSNIALKKKDKVGMLTFSNKIENFLSANRKPVQLVSILENLYNVSTDYLSSDFGLLYAHIQKKITHRSLLLLYTNFEHQNSLQRQLPYLTAIAKKHLLVVIIFENTELNTLINKKAENTPEIMDQTIAEEFSYQKRLMVRELNKYGIQTILTKPEELTVNTINKYLEIKARGIL